MTDIPIILQNAGPTTVPAGSLEADWQARISQPGVVWFHDFGNEAEVDQFRWTGGENWGNDPTNLHPTIAKRGTVNWQTSDGITGGACLGQLPATG